VALIPYVTGPQDQSVSVSDECPRCLGDFHYYTTRKEYAALHRNLEAVLENAPQLILRFVVLGPKLATGGFKVLGIYYIYLLVLCTT
jgi:hypothetical protein